MLLFDIFAPSSYSQNPPRPPPLSSSSPTGFLLSLEGSEGCGKSTQIALLRSRLEQAGQAVEVLREPGGTTVGEQIRHLLQHSREGHSLTPEAELLLFAASRAQIVREKIRPLLAAGVVVIMDRFLDSTTVYQGVARGLPLASVQAINAFAVGETLPALTLILDMPAATAWQRIHASGRELDRMESQPLEFFEKVRQGYLTLASEQSQRLVIVDADQSPEAVHTQIWQHFETRRHHAL